MFIYHFIISNIIVSAVFLIMLAGEGIFFKRLSPRANYFCRLPFIILPYLAFLPDLDLFRFGFSAILPNTHRVISHITTPAPKSIDDFYIAGSLGIYDILTAAWLAGAAVNAVIYASALFGIYKIIARSHYTGSYKDCIIYTSENTAPFSFGLFKKRIVMPHMTDSQRNYALEHEYIHYRHGDNIVNFSLCLLSIFYWFNPIIYFTFNKIRLAMEIYCDYSVMEATGCHGEEYGNTLISLAAKNNRLYFPANNISDTKKHLKMRLIKITQYGRIYGKRLPLLLTAVFAVISSAGFCAFNAFGYSIGSPSLKGRRVEYLSLEDRFGGCEGAFVLYNTSEDKYYVYNPKTACKRFIPYSTHKIPIAVNALENGVITEENNSLEWNGVHYPFEQWNGSQSLNSAFKNSVNWYFQAIDSQSGYINKKAFLNRIGYGNKTIGFNSENYWLDGALKISPLEQVEFLKGLFEGEYGFSHLSAVKEGIKISDGLYGKTGSGDETGWFVGFRENDGDRCYFAVLLKGKGADGSRAYDILKGILYS